MLLGIDDAHSVTMSSTRPSWPIMRAVLRAHRGGSDGVFSVVSRRRRLCRIWKAWEGVATLLRPRLVGLQVEAVRGLALPAQARIGADHVGAGRG